MFPSSSSFRIRHRSPPRFIRIILFVRIGGRSGIFRWCSQTRGCQHRWMEIGWIGCWGMRRRRWKHLGRNRDSRRCWSCARGGAGVGIKKRWCGRLSRRMGGRRSSGAASTRAWTRAVQRPRSRKRSLFDDVLFTAMRKIDFNSDSDDFFTSLCEKSSFLSFEKVTGRTWTHLDVVWWCRWKHGHQVVTCWWCWIFASWHIRGMAKIELSQTAWRHGSTTRKSSCWGRRRLIMDIWRGYRRRRRR